MAALQEILDEMARIKKELQRMEDDDTITEESDGDLRDTLISRWEELDTKSKPLIERMEKIRGITRTVQDESNLERVDGYAPAGGITAGHGGPDLVVRNRRDPFDSMDMVRGNLMRRSELRERALDAIERSNKAGDLGHDYAENATRLAQDNFSGQNNVAKHVLLTGSQEYLDVYRAYLQNPEENASRAALSLTQANGGFLLPYVLDPTIILTNVGSANPWRRISRGERTTSNAWQGVNSAGVNAGWLAEGTAASDNSPTVGQIQITPAKAAAWVYGSFEVLADTDFGQQLPGLLADAKDRLEEAAFATGTGTNQPKGVITAVTGSNIITAATTGAYVLADVYSVHGALPARFRTKPSAAWVMNVATINRTRQFDTAGGSSFWTNLGLDQPEQLLGKGVYESTTMTGTLTTGSKIVVFGDFNQFIIVDRVGVSLLYEPLVKSTATGSPNFPTGQAGWFMFWRVSSDVSTPSAFRVLTT